MKKPFDAYQQAKSCYAAGHFEKAEEILVPLMQVFFSRGGSAESFFASAIITLMRIYLKTGRPAQCIALPTELPRTVKLNKAQSDQMLRLRKTAEAQIQSSLKQPSLQEIEPSESLISESSKSSRGRSMENSGNQSNLNEASWKIRSEVPSQAPPSSKKGRAVDNCNSSAFLALMQAYLREGRYEEVFNLSNDRLHSARLTTLEKKRLAKFRTEAELLWYSRRLPGGPKMRSRTASTLEYALDEADRAQPFSEAPEAAVHTGAFGSVESIEYLEDKTAGSSRRLISLTKVHSLNHFRISGSLGHVGEVVVLQDGSRSCVFGEYKLVAKDGDLLCTPHSPEGVIWQVPESDLVPYIKSPLDCDVFLSTCERSLVHDVWTSSERKCWVMTQLRVAREKSEPEQSLLPEILLSISGHPPKVQEVLKRRLLEFPELVSLYYCDATLDAEVLTGSGQQIPIARTANLESYAIRKLIRKLTVEGKKRESRLDWIIEAQREQMLELERQVSDARAELAAKSNVQPGFTNTDASDLRLQLAAVTTRESKLLRDLENERIKHRLALQAERDKHKQELEVLSATARDEVIKQELQQKLNESETTHAELIAEVENLNKELRLWRKSADLGSVTNAPTLFKYLEAADDNSSDIPNLDDYLKKSLRPWLCQWYPSIPLERVREFALTLVGCSWSVVPELPMLRAFELSSGGFCKLHVIYCSPRWLDFSECWDSDFRAIWQEANDSNSLHLVALESVHLSLFSSWGQPFLDLQAGLLDRLPVAENSGWPANLRFCFSPQKGPLPNGVWQACAAIPQITSAQRIGKPCSPPEDGAYPLPWPILRDVSTGDWPDSSGLESLDAFRLAGRRDLARLCILAAGFGHDGRSEELARRLRLELPRSYAEGSGKL